MKTRHPVSTAMMARNQTRAAMPRLRRALLSIRPKMFLDPLGERHRFSRLGSDVLRLRADEAVVRHLLEHVRGPADDARNGERWWKELFGQADRLQHARRVELDVGRLRPLR